MIELSFDTLSSLCRFSEYLFGLSGKTVAVCKAPVDIEPGKPAPECDAQRCPILRCFEDEETGSRSAKGPGGGVT